MTTRLDRRAFLKGSGALAGGGALAAFPGLRQASVSAQTPSPSPAADPSTWSGVRASFALDPSWLHFAAPVLASHPEPVRAAIAEHRRALDTNTKVYLYTNELTFDEVVARAASDYLGIPNESIAFTDSTTTGLGLLYSGIKVKRGQEVLTSEHDFYATHETLRLRARREGLRFRRVRLFEDSRNATVDEIVGRLRSEIRLQTRVVALTWVHSSTGMKLPVRAIADMIADLNARRDDDDRALLCMDSVHAIGIESESFEDLGCDFLITGCHKWLFGPRGTGVICARSESSDAIEAVVPTFAGPSYQAWLENRDPEGLTFRERVTAGGFRAFEHKWALAEAFRWHLAIGKDRVAQRTHELATRFKLGLNEIDGVDLATPLDEELSAGIVCFMLGNFDPAMVAIALENEFRIAATISPYQVPYIRFMTSIVNSEDEVDEALLAIKVLASQG